MAQFRLNVFRFKGNCRLQLLYVVLKQGFPTFLVPCTPSAFRQRCMHPFNISTDKHVPLQLFNR